MFFIIHEAKRKCNIKLHFFLPNGSDFWCRGKESNPDCGQVLPGLTVRFRPKVGSFGIEGVDMQKKDEYVTFTYLVMRPITVSPTAYVVVECEGLQVSPIGHNLVAVKEPDPPPR